jgi:hypothetical protein
MGVSVSLLDKVISNQEPIQFFSFFALYIFLLMQPFQKNLSCDEKQSEQMVRNIINKSWLKDELIIAQKLQTFIIHDTIKLKFANQKKGPKTMVWKMKRTKPKMNPLQYVLLTNA